MINLLQVSLFIARSSLQIFKVGHCMLSTLLATTYPFLHACSMLERKFQQYSHWIQEKHIILIFICWFIWKSRLEWNYFKSMGWLFWSLRFRRCTLLYRLLVQRTDVIALVERLFRNRYRGWDLRSETLDFVLWIGSIIMISALLWEIENADPPLPVWTLKEYGRDH